MILWLSIAHALDLESTRERATEHAIEVARAEARASEARGRAWVTLSGALPAVELFANASTGAGLTSFGFERPVSSQFGVGVSGRWTLIAPGTWAASDAARHSAKGSRALLDWARVTARRDATVAVAELWGAQAELVALEDAAADARRASDGVQALVASGLRPAADGARTRTAAAALRARAVTARGEVTGRCAALQALLRDPVDGVCTLDPPQIGEPGEAPERHPALIAAEEALSAAKAARTGALLDALPTVAATGTVGEYVAGDASGVGWNAGLEARMPLFTSGAGVGANRMATAERDDAALAYEIQQLGLEAARIAARSRWDSATASLEALEEAASAAEQALDLVDARYREGLEGLEGWLGARRDRDEARIALARGRAEQLRALAEVESVRGVW